MANWSQLLKEIDSAGTTHDAIRRKYLKRLSKATGRNVIAYYSGWLQKGFLAQSGVPFDINDADKSGFMTAIHKLDRSKGLDLILHTPGGVTSATESIVDYLRQMFPNNIRAIVPQLALSAGTMMALACNEIAMGAHSSLGPIDPQLGGIAAHGVVEEAEKAKSEILTNQQAAAYWQFVLQKYRPAFIGDCQKAITWANKMVKDWLVSGMFSGDADATAKADAVVAELADHSLTLSHDRHISLQRAKDMGLKVIALESDDNLQDAVLTVHHAMIHTLAATTAIKIIENHLGHRFVTTANAQLLVSHQS
ncbi:MAG TPA: hypothetical protein VGG64_19485 [Pirellulales bacterium]|jgi:membrane-bound ClpP family serine protease